MQSDLTVSDLQVRLLPGKGSIPIEPLVERLSLELSTAAFQKIVEQGARLAAGKLPVEIELNSARLVDGGAEIVARAKRSILKADLSAKLTFAVVDGKAIRVRVAELDAPGWVPTQMVLAHGMNVAAARPGFTKVEGDDRAIDVDPRVILTSAGLPLAIAEDGLWSLNPTASALGVSFSS
jgi:hypothetical protein